MMSSSTHGFNSYQGSFNDEFILVQKSESEQIDSSSTLDQSVPEPEQQIQVQNPIVILEDYLPNANPKLDLEIIQIKSISKSFKENTLPGITNARKEGVLVRKKLRHPVLKKSGDKPLMLTLIFNRDRTYAKTTTQIGKGAFKIVKLYSHIETQDLFAMATQHIESSEALATFTKEFEHQQQFNGEEEFVQILFILDRARPKGNRKADLLMEYCTHGNLQEYMNKDNNLTLLNNGQVLSFAKGLINGLIKLKSKGIIHRDLKPANLFLTKNNNGEFILKIGDFGCAVKIEDEKAKPKYAGSPQYMAPELLLGYPAYITAKMEIAETDEIVDSFATTSGDVWATGLIIYELLSGGKYLFEEIPENINNNRFPSSENAQETVEEMKRVIKEKIPQLEVDESWKNLLLGMLKTDPKERLSPEACLDILFLLELEFVEI